MIAIRYNNIMINILNKNKINLAGFTLAEVFSPYPKGRNLFAFTLAEVLITLGIIGVVASLTLPALIQNQQKSALEVATKKFYTNMSQAIKHYMADEGVDDLRNTALNAGEWSDENRTSAYKHWTEFMNKYFKVTKICDGTGDCFVLHYRHMDGSEGWNRIAYDQNYVLADGMVIGVLPPDAGVPGTITVDVNGKKGPNRLGYDIWSMSLFYDGTLDEGGVTPECRRNNECNNGYSDASEVRQDRFDVYCLDATGNYGGCFGHFLENGFKFDY